MSRRTRHCERNEAIHLFAPAHSDSMSRLYRVRKIDCFAMLAMTGGRWLWGR
jgi:hypothetical protein